MLGKWWLGGPPSVGDRARAVPPACGFSLGLSNARKENIVIGSLIGWIVLGFVAGFLARLLHPGRNPMTLLSTIILGIVGSLLGGAIAYALRLGTSPCQPGGWILATVGVIVVLAMHWFGFRSRPIMSDRAPRI
jgi:uncharacterized membrane protein YeaQ/YmgE (transglycosylase-associated protein family)